MESIIAWVGENWVNILAWSTEFLAVLFCIHGVFGEKFRVNVAVIVMLVIDIATYAAIWEGLLPKIFSCIPYIITFVYCCIEFKKKIVKTICYYVASIILIGLLEIVASYVIIPLQILISWDELLMLLLNTVSLVLSIFCVQLISNEKKKARFRFCAKKVFFIILLCSLSMVFMLLDYRLRGELDQIYYLVFMGLVVIICFYWVRMQEVQFELEKKDLELDLQEIYGTAYKELIFEVRRKQHDFMNQLGAVYSMHVTATSLEDLIARQREYGTTLIAQDRYDKILTGCNNPILAGYLYNRCVALEKRDVLVEYKIQVDTARCTLSLHEIIEILGILLTNAVESSVVEKQKIIELVIEETSEKLNIEVCNLSKYLTVGEIEKIFEIGYSSKGENRGIGLARIKQLARKSDSEIIVENYMRTEENWIKFKIVVAK